MAKSVITQISITPEPIVFLFIWTLLETNCLRICCQSRKWLRWYVIRYFQRMRNLLLLTTQELSNKINPKSLCEKDWPSKKRMPKQQFRNFCNAKLKRKLHFCQLTRRKFCKAWQINYSSLMKIDKCSWKSIILWKIEMAVANYRKTMNWKVQKA